MADAPPPKAAAKPAAPEPGILERAGSALDTLGDIGLTNINGAARSIVTPPAALVNRLIAAAQGKDGQAAADATRADMDRNFGYQPVTEGGKAYVSGIHNALAPVGQVMGAAGDALEQGGQAIGLAPGTVHNQLSEAGEIAGTVPVLGAVATGARASADAAAQAAANAPEWAAAGFRNADAHPIARGVAGGTGRQALTLHNQAIGNTIAKGEAGVQPFADLSYDTLEGARGAPNAVYNRVAASLPTGPLSEGAAARIRAAGGAGQRMTEGTPDAQNAIQSLRSQLLDPQGQFTGQQVVNEMRGLRQEGYVNIGSEDVSKQQLGKAQLDMARGLEQHVADNLQENAPGTLGQLQQARTALAKNHAVQGALRGSDVDLQALARIQRADPDLLTGGLKTSADFANDNPPVSGLGGRVYSPPSYKTDLGEAAGGKIESLLSPAFYTQVLGGREAARRILTGNTENAVAAARGGYPERFAPVEPRQPAPLDLTAPLGQAFEPRQLSLGDLLAQPPEAPPTGMTGVMSKPEKKPTAKKKDLGEDFK
jgi:hypothetical protein